MIIGNTIENLVYVMIQRMQWTNIKGVQDKAQPGG